jgi:transcriptional regulator with XRE-family HTH domain
MSDKAIPKASRVRAVRVASGMTQRQFAALIGCSYASERRFEYKDTLPKNAAVMANLRRAAKRVGVSHDSSEKRREG